METPRNEIRDVEYPEPWESELGTDPMESVPSCRVLLDDRET